MENRDAYLPRHMSWAENWEDEVFRIKCALEDDNREEFVMLIRSPRLREWEPPFGKCDFGHLIINLGAVRCAEAVLSGATKGFIDPHFGFPTHGWTALHEASLALNVAMLEKFLDSGIFLPDLRGDYDFLSLKRALPLNVALCGLRFITESSAASLLNALYSQMDHLLEAIRLLALNTTEFQQEFFNYAKEGKMVEVGALLLAAGEKLLPLRITEGNDKLVFNSFKEISAFLQAKNRWSAMTNDEFAKWKETLKLLDIYDKLGNQLMAYVGLKENRRSGMEVATLLEAQGSDVKIAGNNFHDYEKRSDNSPFKLRVPQIYDHGELDNWELRKLFRKQVRNIDLFFISLFKIRIFCGVVRRKNVILRGFTGLFFVVVGMYQHIVVFCLEIPQVTSPVKKSTFDDWWFDLLILPLYALFWSVLHAFLYYLQYIFSTCYIAYLFHFLCIYLTLNFSS